jgi:hypothetical protein
VEDEPAEGEMEAVAGMLAAMSPELVNELRDAFEKSSTGEEFVNRVMVGECPKCGSSDTGDCEDDPEIDNPCIGRCFDCGQLWCCDCEELFADAKSTDHDCPAWDGDKYVG